MAQENPSPLAEWFEALRQQIPVIRRHFDEWMSAVREEPALIWQTRTVRYAVYGLGACMILWSAGAMAAPTAIRVTA